MVFGRQGNVLYILMAFAGGATFVFLVNMFYCSQGNRPLDTPGDKPINDITGVIQLLDNSKSKVFSYNGKCLQRLYAFCAWTPHSGCAVIESVSGQVKVTVHHTSSSDVFSVSGSIFRKKVWEVDIMNFILSELDKYPDSGFVDVGCNVGPFSLQAAKYGRHVLAIDPVFENIQKLCKSVEINRLTEKVTMVLNPLSDEHTSVSLDRTPPGFEMTKVVKTKVKVNDSDCTDVEMLDTVMLDDLIPLVLFKTAVLKVDVESFEYHVMNGGRKFLEAVNIPAIIMEWTHVKTTPGGKPLVKLFETLGYDAFKMENVGTYIPLKNYDFINWPHNVVWFKHTL